MSDDKIVLIAKGTSSGSKTRMMPKGTSIFVDGTLSSETITIEYVGINDSDTTPAKDEYGQALVLSESRTDLTMTSKAHIKITKPTTTNPVGVYMILPQ